jgi:hypothetical protein
MTTTLLERDSASLGEAGTENLAKGASSANLDLRERTDGQDPLNAGMRTPGCEPRILSGDDPDLLSKVLDPQATSGMTEDDTVSVLEVLAEMQRIIDRYIEKTEGQQGER